MQSLVGQRVDNRHDPAIMFWHERLLLSRWWQAYFNWIFENGSINLVEKYALDLKKDAPLAAKQLKLAAVKLLSCFGKAVAGKNKNFFSEKTAWKEFHASIHPLTGYLQMHLSNEGMTIKAIKGGFALVERICMFF